MIVLNLISPTKKQELKYRKIYIMIRIFVIFIFLSTIIISIVLSLSNVILINTFNSAVYNTSQINVSAKTFDKDILNLNENLKKIHEIQNKFIPYDELLLEINDLIPQDVNLNSLSANTESKTIIFTGIARIRDKLLEFHNKLKASEKFSEIEFPIKNLLEKTDISFTIKAKLLL